MNSKNLTMRVSSEAVYLVFSSSPSVSLTCTSLIFCGLWTDWTEQQEDPKNAGLWERDWDDDSLSDNFSKSLREQLAKPVKPNS